MTNILVALQQLSHAGPSGIALDILHVERRAADHSANIGSSLPSRIEGRWGQTGEIHRNSRRSEPRSV
jgi:hypothetical protein